MLRSLTLHHLRFLIAAVTGVPFAPVVGQDLHLRNCGSNLCKIYHAVRAYHCDRQELPLLLKNLVEHIEDSGTFRCALANTKIPEPGVFVPNEEDSADYTYLYEWTEAKQGAQEAITYFDYKRLEARRLGPFFGRLATPIARCSHHGTTAKDRYLNLPLSGEPYISELYWEEEFIDVFPHEQLRALQILNGISHLLPPRAPANTPLLIDLSPFFNRTLPSVWVGAEDPRLPHGQFTAAGSGLNFDVRGMVQLGCCLFPEPLDPPLFPSRAPPIPVALGVPPARLHFLVGCEFPADPDTRIGRIEIRSPDGDPTEDEILDLVYGQNLVNSLQPLDELQGDADELEGAALRLPRVAFAGRDYFVQWFVVTWENPERAAVKDVVFSSERTESAPFLLAITAEN